MTDRFAPAVKILQDHQYDSAKLIPILQKVQDEYTYLPEDIMRFVANELDISPAKVFGVATFLRILPLPQKANTLSKCATVRPATSRARPLLLIRSKIT